MSETGENGGKLARVNGKGLHTNLKVTGNRCDETVVVYGPKRSAFEGGFEGGCLGLGVWSWRGLLEGMWR